MPETPTVTGRPAAHPEVLRDLLRSILRSRLSQVGAVIVGILLVMAVFAEQIATHDPFAQPSKRLQPPGQEYVAGTDEFGRDVFSRTVHGARISLYVAFFATLLAGTVGTLGGAVAGFIRGPVDELIMRFADIMLAFPGIVLAIFLSAILGPSLRNATIAIGIVYTPIFARIARGQVLTICNNEYVEAGRAMGGSEIRLLFRHVMPNSAAPIIVQVTISFANAIIAESSLSFLGLGAQPPQPSWGTMLSTGRLYMEIAPWVVILPAVAISLTVLGLNLFGDALRDILDPHLDFRR